MDLGVAQDQKFIFCLIYVDLRSPYINIVITIRIFFDLVIFVKLIVLIHSVLTHDGLIQKG